jgi:hypothetical protein
MEEERPELHAVPGGYEDQVVRRQRFEAAHPEVRIAPVRAAWQAIIPTERGEDVVTRYELRHLLDELERRLASREGDDGR